MNRDNFFKALRKRLRRLKSPEIQKNISYYDEMLSDMTENGLTEEEALAKIGSPEQLAREILENAAPESFRKKDTAGRVLTAASIITILLSIAEAVRMRIMFNTTVSIIGGADGPTSVFIAGKLNWPRIYVIAAVLVAVTVIYFLFKHIKAKK